MNIFSCDGCGGVFDLDKVDLPDPDTYGDHDRDEELFSWQYDRMVPVFKCPICKEENPVMSK